MSRAPTLINDPLDGLPVMSVGEWATRKHDLIGRYAEAARRARAKFPSRCYVDLFCGPGKIFVQKTGLYENGSALTAWQRTASREGSFTNIIVGDIDQASVDACAQRLRSLDANVLPLVGPAEHTVDLALAKMPLDGLHLALLDPFNLANLSFDVIRKLSERKHVDIIVHFSAFDLKRNLELDYKKERSLFDFVAPGWRSEVSLEELSKRQAHYAFIDYWKSLISNQLQMKVAHEAPDFTNSNNGLLYWLFLLYRNPLADKIWASFRTSETRSLF